MKEAGVQAHPQSFFCQKSVKIWANSLKNRAIKKWRPTLAAIHEDVFLEVIPKRCSWYEILAQNFLGKFGEIREEIFRTPKNLPAPTPMVHKLYVKFKHWKSLASRRGCEQIASKWYATLLPGLLDFLFFGELYKWATFLNTTRPKPFLKWDLVSHCMVKGDISASASESEIFLTWLWSRIDALP